VNVGFLSEILNTFVDAFSGGFDRLRPAVGALLHLLMALDVIYFGLMVLFGMELVQSGLRKLFVLSVWAYAVGHFDEMATSMVDSLVQAGLTAAGQGGTSPRLVLNPSLILDGAFTATEPIAKAVMEVPWYSLNFTYVFYMIVVLFMVVAYFALALTALMAVIEYYLALSIAGILLPFGVLGPTRWIAMKPLSYFLSVGLKLMVVAFIAAISRTVFAKIHFASAEPTFREMMVACCASWTLGLLAWKAPQQLAAGIMAGAASFGASDAVNHAASTASVASRGASPLTSQKGQAAIAGSGRGVALGVVGGVAAVGAAAWAGVRAASKGVSNGMSKPSSEKSSANSQRLAKVAGSGSPMVASATTSPSKGPSKGPTLTGPT
jgi:type IV secretion system protein TrbL